MVCFIFIFGSFLLLILGFLVCNWVFEIVFFLGDVDKICIECCKVWVNRNKY